MNNRKKFDLEEDFGNHSFNDHYTISYLKLTLAVLYVPVCVKLGLSIPSTIIILAAAAALGDAGSPVSDTTLGPTSGLNADNQHNHIWDTCVPTFLHYNIAIIITAVMAVSFFK